MCPLNRNHKQPNLWEATVWLLSLGHHYGFSAPNVIELAPTHNLAQEFVHNNMHEAAASQHSLTI